MAANVDRVRCDRSVVKKRLSIHLLMMTDAKIKIPLVCQEGLCKSSFYSRPADAEGVFDVDAKALRGK